MTPHARRLLAYAMTQGLKGQQAEEWLDTHTPCWREHDEPQARRCYDYSPTEQEGEQ